MNFVALATVIAFTLACAAGAFVLRNLIRSVLLLVGAWTGIALYFLAAGAEFAAFAQFLIYVGAVSMVALFAVLLTRGGRPGGDAPSVAPSRSGRLWAVLAGAAVFGVLAATILRTPLGTSGSPPAPLPVREFGRELMGAQAPALLEAGVLLTAALIGAVVLAAPDKPKP